MVLPLHLTIVGKVDTILTFSQKPIMIVKRIGTHFIALALCLALLASCKMTGSIAMSPSGNLLPDPSHEKNEMEKDRGFFVGTELKDKENCPIAEIAALKKDIREATFKVQAITFRMVSSEEESPQEFTIPVTLYLSAYQFSSQLRSFLKELSQNPGRFSPELSQISLKNISKISVSLETAQAWIANRWQDLEVEGSMVELNFYPAMKDLTAPLPAFCVAKALSIDDDKESSELITTKWELTTLEPAPLSAQIGR